MLSVKQGCFALDHTLERAPERRRRTLELLERHVGKVPDEGLHDAPNGRTALPDDHATLRCHLEQMRTAVAGVRAARDVAPRDEAVGIVVQRRRRQPDLRCQPRRRDRAGDRDLGQQAVVLPRHALCLQLAGEEHARELIRRVEVEQHTAPRVLGHLGALGKRLEIPLIRLLAPATSCELGLDPRDFRLCFVRILFDVLEVVGPLDNIFVRLVLFVGIDAPDECFAHDLDLVRRHPEECRLVHLRAELLRDHVGEPISQCGLPLTLELEVLACLMAPPLAGDLLSLHGRTIMRCTRTGRWPGGGLSRAVGRVGNPDCILYGRRVAKILQEREALVRNASAAATELIRVAIVDGGLAPGQRLKEEELARELGISRTPIREALLVLQAEGLVDATPNRGATVRSHSAEDLDDLYQLRALLEGFAARRAAARLSEDQVAELWASCERFDRLGDDGVREIVRENMLFHNTILDGAGSSRLAQMVKKTIELPLVYKSYIWYSPDQLRISGHYHRQIARALAARDGERAEMIMKEHVFEARDLLVAHVRDLESETE